MDTIVHVYRADIHAILYLHWLLVCVEATEDM